MMSREDRVKRITARLAMDIMQTWDESERIHKTLHAAMGEEIGKGATKAGALTASMKLCNNLIVAILSQDDSDVSPDEMLDALAEVVMGITESVKPLALDLRVKQVMKRAGAVEGSKDDEGISADEKQAIDVQIAEIEKMFGKQDEIQN